MLQKVSVWVGFVVPVEAIISRVCPVQSPHRPTRFAKKRHGRLKRFLLAFIPTRIQAVLGHLPTDWGQNNMPKGKSWGLLEHSEGLQPGNIGFGAPVLGGKCTGICCVCVCVCVVTAPPVDSCRGPRGSDQPIQQSKQEETGRCGSGGAGVLGGGAGEGPARG